MSDGFKSSPNADKIRSPLGFSRKRKGTTLTITQGMRECVKESDSFFLLFLCMSVENELLLTHRAGKEWYAWDNRPPNGCKSFENNEDNKERTNLLFYFITHSPTVNYTRESIFNRFFFRRCGRLGNPQLLKLLVACSPPTHSTSFSPPFFLTQKEEKRIESMMMGFITSSCVSTYDFSKKLTSYFPCCNVIVTFLNRLLYFFSLPSYFLIVSKAFLLKGFFLYLLV